MIKSEESMQKQSEKKQIFWIVQKAFQKNTWKNQSLWKVQKKEQKWNQEKNRKQLILILTKAGRSKLSRLGKEDRRQDDSLSGVPDTPCVPYLMHWGGFRSPSPR